MISGMAEQIRPMTVTDLKQVLDAHPRFWGDRDLRAYHIAPLVHEFPHTCLVAEDPGTGDGVRGYVLGFVTPDRVGYVHLIATRDDTRGTGLGRRLWEAFSKTAAEQGADRLRAITSVTNTGSQAFHASLGFELSVDEDYNGPGDARIVFTRALM
ncbi:MAG: GNAT family N-acetyltransferase [Catenulispora sp.]|nr:GNAT family N-acetyltransferase [Catenulispora sp.]